MMIKEKLIYFVKFRFKGNGIFTCCSTGEDVNFINGNDYNNLIIGHDYELVCDENNMEIRVVGGK